MSRNVLKYLYLFYLLILVLLLIESCTQPLTLNNMAYDEPGYYMFGRTPQRSFYSDVTVGEVIEKWSNETSGSQSASSVVIYNDIVFVNDLSGRVYGFDRITGKLLGYEKYNGSIEVSPVINNLRIFFVVNEKFEKYSTFTVFDFVKGKVLHEEQIQGGVKNELIRTGDGIIVLTDRGELIKFNLVGYRDWSIQTNSSTQSSPALTQIDSTSTGQFIIFGNQSGELIFVSARTGEIKSKIKFANAITGGITIENGTAYFVDETGKVYSFNIIEKKINWVVNTGTKILTIPVMDNSKIYIGNLGGSIFAIDKNSGAQIWKTGTQGIINTTPLITKNVLIQPEVNKKIFFINTSDGTINKTLEFDRRTKLNPVIYDSLLYVGSDRGIIHAYKIYSNK